GAQTSAIGWSWPSPQSAPGRPITCSCLAECMNSAYSCSGTDVWPPYMKSRMAWTKKQRQRTDPGETVCYSVDTTCHVQSSNDYFSWRLIKSESITGIFPSIRRSRAKRKVKYL